MIWPHVALLLFYTLHSAMADASVKEKLYAFIPKRWYRLSYNMVSTVTLGVCLYLYVDARKSYLFSLSEFGIVIGLAILVAGMYLLIAALKGYDTGAFMGISEEKAGETLKTDGWNGVVRHPIYLAVFLIVWGLFLAVPMDIFLGMALITTGYIFVGIRLEERKLMRQFGAMYEEYQREVPMLLPSIKFRQMKLFTRK
jgi:methanethiol S-methyltransferase